MHKEIHSFENFSISRTRGGDYVAELDGTEVLLISPNGSDEHKHEIDWIEAARTEGDFLSAYPEIAISTLA